MIRTALQFVASTFAVAAIIACSPAGNSPASTSTPPPPTQAAATVSSEAYVAKQLAECMATAKVRGYDISVMTRMLQAFNADGHITAREGQEVLDICNRAVGP